ncbi:PH domain-containing protein [Polymorphospora sp. NPDC050346]|uniref:PH domain-containing protein n=1 Tax=Polymorphospora sp. NPDC050346 TaxID=3155780 RepID=UPI0033F19516
MGDVGVVTSWRVARSMPLLKLVSAAALLLIGYGLAGGDPVTLGLAVLVAVVLLGWAVRDLVVPVRLAVDEDGVTVVTGYARRRHLPWGRIERITVDTRPRLGLRTETLEIDAGDSLHLLGAYDLGAAPADVAATLQAARRVAAGDPPG